jgi:hypothetical protein
MMRALTFLTSMSRHATARAALSLSIMSEFRLCESHRDLKFSESLQAPIVKIFISLVGVTNTTQVVMAQVCGAANLGDPNDGLIHGWVVRRTANTGRFGCLQMTLWYPSDTGVWWRCRRTDEEGWRRALKKEKVSR